MKIELLLMLPLFFTVNNSYSNNLILDYFVHKNTKSVALFLCNNDADKILLVKHFNSRNMKVVFAKFLNDSREEYLIRTDYSKMGVFIDLNCYNDDFVMEFFLEASVQQFYREMHNWLILGSKLGSTLKMIKDVEFCLSTDFVLAIPGHSTDDYQLYDIYNPWKYGGGQLNITRLGFWNEVSGLNIALKQSKFFRRSNLRGMTITAAFFGSKYRPKDKPLSEYLQDYSSRTKDGLSKFGYIVLTHLSEMFNLTLNFTVIELTAWKPGDTVGPMSRNLASQKAQITGTPIIMSLPRLRLTRFVYPTWPFRTCFIFRTPQNQDIKVTEILKPLSADSWVSIFIFSVFLFIVLGNTLRFEQEDLSVSRFSNAFILIIGTMCQQGTNFTFTKLSTQILFFHVIIFGFLIFTFYSAFIISVKINEPIIKINDSLNELVKTGLKFGSEPMIYFDFILKKVPAFERKLFYDRWMKIPENEKFLVPEKAIPMVKKGEFAYHSHPDSSYPLIDRTFSYRETCELTEVHMQQSSYSTLAVAHNSTFVEMAKIGFARMSEVGIRKRQVIRWTASKPQCQRDLISVSNVDMYEFAPFLIILLIGILAALVILGIEKAIYNYTSCKRIDKSAQFSIDFANALSNSRQNID